MPRRRPHILDLYRLAVQHPSAEVSFLLRAYSHYRDGALPTKLKEDFAGTSVVAAEWVGFAEDHRAIAVESHGPTLRWAQRLAKRQLNDRAEDLHFVEADVLDITAPRVDVIAALNFSAFIYHTRDDLRNYFRHARRSLSRDGILAIDVYGGRGAMRVGEQKVRITPEDADPFTYHWDQRACDEVTAKVDCRIHFTLSDGQLVQSAFRYDWRLWTLPELVELMNEAGFSSAEVWCDEYSEHSGTSDGYFRPMPNMPAREDFVAYVIGVK